MSISSSSSSSIMLKSGVVSTISSGEIWNILEWKENKNSLVFNF